MLKSFFHFLVWGHNYYKERHEKLTCAWHWTRGIIGQLITLISIVSQFVLLSDLENSLKFKRMDFFLRMNKAIKSLEILLHQKNCVTNRVYAKEEEEEKNVYSRREYIYRRRGLSIKWKIIIFLASNCVCRQQQYLRGKPTFLCLFVCRISYTRHRLNTGEKVNFQFITSCLTPSYLWFCALYSFIRLYDARWLYSSW